MRQADVLVRRGGDEFALLMPGTAAKEARVIAQRIQEAVAALALPLGGETLKQTVSIGVATWDGHEAPDGLERRADLAMYEAKRLGRNCVAVARESARMARDPRTALRRVAGGAR